MERHNVNWGIRTIYVLFNSFNSFIVILLQLLTNENVISPFRGIEMEREGKKSVYVFDFSRHKKAHGTKKNGNREIYIKSW